MDAVLIGTTKHFETLSRKELAQPFGLKDLAKTLKDYVKEDNFKTKINTVCKLLQIYDNLVNIRVVLNL